MRSLFVAVTIIAFTSACGSDDDCTLTLTCPNSPNKVTHPAAAGQQAAVAMADRHQ